MMSEVKLNKSGCIAAATVVALVLMIIVFLSCSEKVEADQVGVRTIMTSTGVEQKDHRAGYVLAIPGFHSVRLWDPTWSNLVEILQVRGSDQYTTQVDISVVYRIEPEKCFFVATHFRDENHVEQLVRNTLNKFANEILAQMATEDFFNSKERDMKANEAQKAMDEQLRPMGIEVRYLLLRNILYDRKFESQLLQKQLAGQRKSLEMAKGQLAAAQTQTELIKQSAQAEVKRIDENKRQEMENLQAETDRKINKILQDAKLKASTILAKAESIRRQKLAQAELLKATAAAAGTEAMSKVYARPGASYYFARQALDGMRLGEVELNSTYFNPLDSERLLKALGLDMQPSPGTVPLPKNPGK